MLCVQVRCAAWAGGPGVAGPPDQCQAEAATGGISRPQDECAGLGGSNNALKLADTLKCTDVFHAQVYVCRVCGCCNSAADPGRAASLVLMRLL